MGPNDGAGAYEPTSSPSRSSPLSSSQRSIICGIDAHEASVPVSVSQCGIGIQRAQSSEEDGGIGIGPCAPLPQPLEQVHGPFPMQQQKIAAAPSNTNPSQGTRGCSPSFANLSDLMMQHHQHDSAPDRLAAAAAHDMPFAKDLGNKLPANSSNTSGSRWERTHSMNTASSTTVHVNTNATTNNRPSICKMPRLPSLSSARSLSQDCRSLSEGSLSIFGSQSPIDVNDCGANENSNMAPLPSTNERRRSRIRSHQVMTDSSSNDGTTPKAADKAPTTKPSPKTDAENDNTSTASSKLNVNGNSNIKLQPAISIESRRSSMQHLRTRRRMWLEEQARQIEMEERCRGDSAPSNPVYNRSTSFTSKNNTSSLSVAGLSAQDLASAMMQDHSMDDDDQEADEGVLAAAATAPSTATTASSGPGIRRPSAAADAAALAASNFLGSPLPPTGKSSSSHFHNRSVSITGMSIPSPASDRFILNLPNMGGSTSNVGDDGTIVEGLAEMEAMEEEQEDPEVSYAIGGGDGDTDFCMDEDSNEDETTVDGDADDDDDDTATVIMDEMENDDHVPQGAKSIALAAAAAAAGDAEFKVDDAFASPPSASAPLLAPMPAPLNQQHHYFSVPNFARFPTFSHRRRSDEEPYVMDHYPISKDLVIPPRPHSSEPRFDTLVQGFGLQPKMIDRPVGRILSGPVPPPPPLCGPGGDDANEENKFSSRPSSRASSRPPEQSLLQEDEGNSNQQELPLFRRDPTPTPSLQLDKIAPPPCIWEEEHPSQSNARRSTFVEQALDKTRTISFADGEGVEVSLPAHLSVGFDALKAASPVDEDTPTASFPPKPANVASFDRSASIRASEPLMGLCDKEQARGAEEAMFTPPTVKTEFSLGPPKGSFTLQGMLSKGNENAPPGSNFSSSCASSDSLMKMPPISMPGIPQAPLMQLPNLSSVGRSASMGGQYLGSPDGSNFRTPGHQVQPSQLSDIMKNSDRRKPQQLPYRPPDTDDRRPLPSLPLPPTDKDDEDDDAPYNYTSPPGRSTGPFVAFTQR